jgi:lysozyme family protein
MIKFDAAFNYVLSWEGGFSDDKRDSGGITQYGISEKLLKSIGWKYGLHDVTSDTIKSLSKEQAKNIYHDQFWKPLMDEIDDQDIVNYYFDSVVNIGQYWGTVILQRATWCCGNKYLDDDGVFGAGTLACVNNSIGLMPAFKSERSNYYRRIVAGNSSQSCFLKGWLNRAYVLRGT